MQLHTLLLIPSWLVLAAVFVLPALESSTLIGVVIPGETAVLLGGVLAHFGRAPLLAVMAVAVLGAVVGDSLGYALGRRLGPSVSRRVPFLVRGRARSAELLRHYGALAVLLGRWVAVVRAVIPVVAGGSGIPYRSFALYNVTGGVIWGAGVAGAGYVVGAAYAGVERSLGVAGGVVVAVVLLLVLLSHLVIRRKRRPGLPG